MTTIDLPDGEYTAVVDSIEDGLATVFFEQDGDVGNAIMDADQLPDDGIQADAVLSVTVVSGTIDQACYDPEQTEKRAEAAQNRFDRLSSRPPTKDDT